MALYKCNFQYYSNVNFVYSDFDGRPACYQKKLLKSRQKARSHCPSDLSFTVKQKYVYRYYVKPMAEPNNLEFPAWGYQKKIFSIFILKYHNHN